MIPDDAVRLSGGFANYFEVGCTREEIIVRVGIRYDSVSEPTLVYTLITTPGYAAQLMDLLRETLRQHALNNTACDESRPEPGSPREPLN